MIFNIFVIFFITFKTIILIINCIKFNLFSITSDKDSVILRLNFTIYNNDVKSSVNDDVRMNIVMNDLKKKINIIIN